MLPTSLAPLAAWPQFMLYKLVPRGDRVDKIPVSPHTLAVGVDAHDPDNWIDATTAVNLAPACGPEYGVAFVFTTNDPFFFLDIDHAWDGQQWSPVAQQLFQLMAGAAVEVSSSGTGLHMFGTYSGAEPDHGCKNTELGLELYTSKRFVALTGNMLTQEGSAGAVMNGQLSGLISGYFSQSANTPSYQEIPWSEEPVSDWSGPTDDDVLINKMLQSGNSAAAIFGGKASFADLWNGNVERLAIAYPSNNPDDPYGRSEADAALAQHLAFWTGKDMARMERLMRRSALVRPKWDRHKSYIRRTVSGAAAGQSQVYSTQRNHSDEVSERRPEGDPIQEVPEQGAIAAPQYRSGHQYLTATNQMELFAGCAYIQDRHAVWVPQGFLLNPQQFKATFGGYEYSISDEKTTRNAWEAFTESHLVSFPKLRTTCFRPEEPPGAVIQEEGQTMINTYAPIETPRVKGDVTPFLSFMKKLLPVDRDREILLSYMASMVQNPGYKFQWCPLLQGVEGNGKTLIITAMSYAVGKRYTHLPNANDLASKFNGWIENKLLIGVEEIYVSDRREATEALKPMVTNARIEIQRKGVDQTTGDNRANFIMCTNHKDAIHTSLDTRRYCMMFTGQQSKQDKIRDGMIGDYFPNLYRWANNGGWAIINEYLHTYPVAAEFDPAGVCQEAPQSSSTPEAILLSLGTVEQEIMEAIGEGRQGFCGGWVSSVKLSDLLDRNKASRRVPPNKRPDMMRMLGYEKHPGLHDGRSPMSLAVENGKKPVLYIKQGHIHANLTTPKEIVAAYEKAQNYPMGVMPAQQESTS